jgi:hypothetical protein
MEPYNFKFIGPLEEETSDGVSMTGDHWRLSFLTPPAQILAFMGMVRVATLGQLARFHFGRVSSVETDRVGSTIRSKEWLEALVLTNGWLGRFNLSLPKTCGGGQVTVFHITERGRKALRKEALPLSDLARPGKPKNNNLKNVPHDLLITEAVLRILDSGCEILEFTPESTLRRIRINQRGEGWVNLSEHSEALPDISVLLRLPKDKVIRVDCEISVELDADQIKKKPLGLHWFVSTQHKADLIQTVRGKGERVSILGDVREPFCEEALNEVDPTKNADKENPEPLAERDLHVLELLGGVATAAAIAAVRSVDRTLVSRTLSALARKGRVRHCSAQLRPGKSRGKPPCLFALSSETRLSLDDRKKALTLSLIVATLALEGFLVSYDRTMGILQMVHKDRSNERPLMMVIDDESMPTVSVADIVRTCSYRNPRSTNLRMAVADAAREQQLRLLCPGVETYNVVGDF